MLYRFVGALQENRAQSKILYFLNDEEAILKFFQAFGLNFKPNFIFQTSLSDVSVICSLVKHAEIRQLQSLLELFKIIDWLARRQLTITNWTSAKLSALFQFQTDFERRRIPSKFASFKVRFLV